MFNKLKNRYYLSNNEAKLIKQGVLFNALSNISKMLPVGICTYLLSNMSAIISNKNTSYIPIQKYVTFSIIAILIMFIFSYIEYTKTYIDIYRESANRRIDIAEFLRKLPLSFFAKRDIADITTAIMTDTSGIEHALAHVIPQAYGTIISTIVVCIALAIFNFKLELALFWVIPIAFLVVLLSRKIQNGLGNQFKKDKLDCSNEIQATLEMIKEIKSFSLEDEYKEKLKNQLNNFENSQKKSELFSATILGSAQMILKLGIATVIIIGSDLLLKGEVNLYTYIIFLFSAGLVYDPIYGLMNSLTEVFSTDILTKRINDIKSEKTFDGVTKFNNSKFDITFDKVSFGYSDSKVIDNVSFTAKEGEKTALVGTSGSGKSTLLKLAARFYDVSSGNIYLGNQKIADIDAEVLLKYYSVVFQDVLLFDNTIMENIRLGNKNSTDKEVIDAAKLANCHDFIMELPNGYDTYIGENGKLLSGGEKQRISIARAIIKDAPIVLLDEVTSALDIENENLVQEALSYVTKNKTVLVIAHKLDTIKHCDKIVVLQDGKLVDEGTHSQLMSKDGLYKKLENMKM